MLDVMSSPAALVVHPEWRRLRSGAHGRDPRRTPRRVIEKEMMICGAHFPFPGAGTFPKDGGGISVPLQNLTKCGGGTRRLAQSALTSDRGDRQSVLHAHSFALPRRGNLCCSICVGCLSSTHNFEDSPISRARQKISGRLGLRIATQRQDRRRHSSCRSL